VLKREVGGGGKASCHHVMEIGSGKIHAQKNEGVHAWETLFIQGGGNKETE